MSNIVLIDLRAREEDYPLGHRGLAVQFQDEQGRQAGYEMGFEMGATVGEVVSRLRKMADGLEKAFKVTVSPNP